MYTQTVRAFIQRIHRDLLANREYALRSVFLAFGGLFLLIESYEVITVGGDVQLPYLLFLLAGPIAGLGWFYLDGHLLAGFLKRHITIKNKSIDTPVLVKFGDLFAEQGWKAIGVNDYL